MKENRYFRNIALTVVLGIVLAVCRVISAVLPLAILPKLDIPNLMLLFLVAILADHYFAAPGKEVDVFTCLFAALTVGLLPLVSGFAGAGEAVKLAAVGGIGFFLTAWVFGSVEDRLATGPAAKAAPVFTALGLYLAAQGFAGMIL